MPTGRLPQTEPRSGSEATAPKIKGAAFIEILKWYSATHGDDPMHRAVAKMPPELSLYVTRPEAPTLGLLVGSWYPAQLVGIVFQEMTRDLTLSQTRKLAADAVQASVGTTLSGIYASFIRLLVSPTVLADHYQKIWRLYHSTGQFTVITHSPTHQEFQLYNWPAHDSFICMMNHHATKLILEIIGMKEVNGITRNCVDRGDSHCAYVQKWKA